MVQPAPVDPFGSLPEARPLGAQPTPRQSQILDLIAAGLPDKEIARRLGLSRSTVRTHIERFFAASGLHDRAGAAALWVRMNVSR